MRKYLTCFQLDSEDFVKAQPSLVFS
jgi:hypothetical protein